ncbi:NAD(P)/FAD-dependent oxidoreductase [Paracoccus pacificus]|uniref:NAD(P)/FAD-dependent oxidoreductase n=1 Tax=Paracoccus pacificus TaxID=1463598 RepID=A0ABW4R3X0_9RHOB
MQRVVIIGSGQGGYQMAASLRQDGFAGSVTLIGEEPGLPYQRPPLSKAYMADGDASRVLLKPESFYERASISVVADRVTTIDRRAQAVLTEGGERHPYDHLVIATGSRPLRPAIAGLEVEGVLQLRTLADAARLRDSLSGCRHAVVIGGGFIGLEFAAVARGMGVGVTLVEAGPRLMARALSPEMSAHFLAAHRDMGTEVLLDAMVVSVDQVDGRALGVTLRDGRMIAGDLILLAAGVCPNAELAADAGLPVANGVVVDADLLTADPAISALGDCANFPAADGTPIRLESVQAAVDHARHISRRLTSDARAPYDAVPWFWSDQGDLKLQIAGIGANADERIVIDQDGVPMVLCFRDGRLEAVETINAPGQHIAARKLIGVPLELLKETGFDLKAAAKSAAGKSP